MLSLCFRFIAEELITSYEERYFYHVTINNICTYTHEHTSTVNTTHKAMSGSQMLTPRPVFLSWALSVAQAILERPPQSPHPWAGKKQWIQSNRDLIWGFLAISSGIFKFCFFQEGIFKELRDSRNGMEALFCNKIMFWLMAQITYWQSVWCHRHCWLTPILRGLPAHLH